MTIHEIILKFSNIFTMLIKNVALGYASLNYLLTTHHYKYHHLAKYFFPCPIIIIILKRPSICFRHLAMYFYLDKHLLSFLNSFTILMFICLSIPFIIFPISFISISIWPFFYCITIVIIVFILYLN